MFNFKTIAAASLALVLTAGAASAATITVVNLGDGQAAYDQVDVNAGVDLQLGVSLDAAIVSGNVSSVYRSPYDNSGTAGVTGFEQLEYFSVGPNVANNPSPATMTLSSSATILSLLWGSIDSYNAIELFDGLTSLGLVTNTDIAPSSSEPGGQGASYVRIFSDMAFDSIKFISSSNAFEFANVTVNQDGEVGAVPLPAGMVLMLTALGGLAVARRRTAV